MQGYFEWAHKLSSDPINGELTPMFFGFLVLAAPIGVPLHWLGVAAAEVLAVVR